jgi:large subunit ribosomal protein L18
MLAKVLKRIRRHARVRSKVSGTATKPRLSIFRSNSNIYAQLIDDVSRKTL